MKPLTLAFALALLAVAGCAQLNEPNAHAGATATDEQSPYPSRAYRNNEPFFVP